MGLASIVGKTLTYPTIGLLPEQEFFTRQLNRFGEWYDPDKATEVSAITQAIGGFTWGVMDFSNSIGFFGGIFLTVEGLNRNIFLNIANEPHVDYKYTGDDEYRRRYVNWINEENILLLIL